MANEITKYQDDFNEDENKSLQEFIKKGCPGLPKIAGTDTFEWFQLYMAGKSYSEIALSCNTKKELVLYIAHKLEWNTKKIEYYGGIAANLVQRTQAVKIESAGTIATMISALNQYFGDKFTSYIKTKNEKFLEGIDVKMLGQYYKSLEVLEKLMGGGGDSKAQPAVNINVGSSASVEQKIDGSVVVTDNSAKEILHLLSQYKKKMSDDDI